MVIEAAICQDGSTPSVEFIEGLDDTEKAKIFGLFRKIDSHGQLRNREQFKQIDGKLFEFKSHQIRIPCFRDGAAWILTHGFIKKSDRIPPAQVDRANRIRDEDLEQRRKRS